MPRSPAPLGVGVSLMVHVRVKSVVWFAGGVHDVEADAGEAKLPAPDQE